MAGLFALGVHAGFFGLLYLGMRWHIEPPSGMEVELWSDLPGQAMVLPDSAAEKKPVEEPPQKQATKQPVKQAAPEKPDISLADRKKGKEKTPKKLTKEEKERLLKEMVAQSETGLEEARSESKERAMQAARRKSQIDSEVEKYKGLIRSRIRAGIVMPPDVPGDAVAEFVVTLLPDGSLLSEPRLVKSSGNAAYDKAVERAIRKPSRLPLPEDEVVKAEFINPKQLTLRFSPGDAR